MSEYRNRGFSLIELLIVVAIILIIASIAIPSFIHSKIAANESSAVGSLHSLNTAAVNYAGEYGLGYPATLAKMGPSTSPSSAAADLVDAVLDSGVKGGYNFSYVAGTPGSDGTIPSYSITATPITSGLTGTRGFYTDQTNVIRADPNGNATSSSTPLN
jgi:prepilin-type N-terminal cleavage/methylation domain-containing protein